MGGLQTTLCRVALCLIGLGQAPNLAAQTLPDPMATLAICTGRLSALMEFQWLVQDPASDATEASRDAMAEVLDAATPVGQSQRALALRIEAKVAAARLLHRARFGPTGAAADWASKRAARLLADCAALMVS